MRNMVTVNFLLKRLKPTTDRKHEKKVGIKNKATGITTAKTTQNDYKER